MKSEKKVMAEIAARMRQRRQELGYSYQDLADLTGMNKSSLQRYETGAIANVPLHRIQDLASALQCSPEWLMGWKENDEPVTGQHTQKQLEGMIRTIAVANDPQLTELFKAAWQLNSQGILQLLDYSKYLLEKPVYRKKTKEESSTSDGAEDKMA